MWKMIAKVLVLLLLGSCLTIFSLDRYGSYRDEELKTNIGRVYVGMSKNEVISILGEPTTISISDIPGTYWSYQPRPLTSLRDPFNESYLLLEMGPEPNSKVVKVFPVGNE